MEDVKTDLSDLLAQHLGLDDHSFRVDRFPKRSREYRDVDLFEANPNSQVFDSRPEEELVTEERLDNGRQACT